MLWRRRTRLDEEVASHLAQETADNIARGMEPGAARSAAMRTFGNVEAAKEMVRELDPLYWVDTLWQDIRFAIRLIARSRWLSATIVATLTVGITINVSVFSLLNGFFLRQRHRRHARVAAGALGGIRGRLVLHKPTRSRNWNPHGAGGAAS